MLKKFFTIIISVILLLVAGVALQQAEAGPKRPLSERLNPKWDFKKFPVRFCPICGAGSWTTAAGQIQTHLTALSGASTSARTARLVTRGAANLAELKQGIEDLKTQLQQAQVAKDALDGSNFDSIANIAQERANAADTVNKIKGYLLRGLLARVSAEKGGASSARLQQLNQYEQQLLGLVALDSASLPALNVPAGQTVDLGPGEHRFSSLTVGGNAKLVTSGKIIVAGDLKVSVDYGRATEIQASEIDIFGPYNIQRIGGSSASSIKINTNILNAPDSRLNTNLTSPPIMSGYSCIPFEVTGDVVVKFVEVGWYGTFKAKKVFTAGDISIGAYSNINADEVHIQGSHNFNINFNTGSGSTIGLLNMPDSQLYISYYSYLTATDKAIVKNIVTDRSSLNATTIYNISRGDVPPQIVVNEPAEYFPPELANVNANTVLNTANQFP